MVVAIFGRCCVGKSSVANTLGHKLHCTVRHCGELVKTRASSCGKKPDELDAHDHEMIDRETRAVVESANSPLIIEGSFLDAVIGKRSGVYLVHLVCSDSTRADRYATRCDGVAADIVARDRRDSRLRQALYGTTCWPLEADVTIDTTVLSADETAERILRWLETV